MRIKSYIRKQVHINKLTPDRFGGKKVTLRGIILLLSADVICQYSFRMTWQFKETADHFNG